MKFGSTPLEDAEGCVLAHAVRLEAGTLKKGKVLSAADIALLQSAGHKAVIAARLGIDDIAEDEAARRICAAICGDHAVAQQAFTGRANIYAATAGLVVVDEARLRAINHLHESLTLATLANFARVNPRDMLATVKIIPFAMPRAVLDRAIGIVAEMPLVQVAPFQRKRVGLVITRLPQTKQTIIEKTENAMRDRVMALGGLLDHVVVCEHATAAIAQEVGAMENVEVVLLFGASAIIDRADVIPSGLEAAGGSVLHLGMPVDPGNLLMLGVRNNVPVIGVPTCARSPKTNGFDWVLNRVMAGISVSPSEIMDMGAGGLLAEIISRPSPREPAQNGTKAPRLAAVVLAAGSSTRMGSNKLLADVNGQAMIGRTVDAVRAAIEKVVVVTGHEAELVQQTLAGRDISFVHNARFAEGLSTSLRAGVAALKDDVDAILVCLGDMPLITARDIGRMVAAFSPADGRSIVVPVHGRRFGNPVLWGADHFAALMACEGDRGARGLLETLHGDVVEIEMEHAGVLLDADTPEALAAVRARFN